MEGAQVEIVDNKTFENGMQLSSDIRTQDPGTYSKAVNVRKGSSVRNDKENIYNIKSNVLIQNTLPAGVNTTLFTLEDIRNSGIIFWNHNSLGFHGIYRYLSQSNTIEKILHKQPILNFQLSTRINHADIIFNGDDDLLYWTYGYDETDIPAGKWVQNVTKPGKIVAGEWYYNPPRKINIRKALAYTANAWEFQDNGFSSGNTYFVYPGSTLPSWATIGTAVAVQQNPGFTNPEYNTLATIIGINNPVPNSILLNIQFKTPTPPEGGFIVPQNIDTYYGITYQVLDALKYPPLFSPIAAYTTDQSFKRNFLKERLSQYAYRYHYDDNEVSVISPLSNLILPAGSESIAGQPTTLLSVNNRVDITLNTGSEIVRRIDILERVAGAVDTAGSPLLFLIDSLDKKALSIPNNSTYVYLYYGDKVKESVDNTDIGRPFDFVPQVSDCEAIIQKNVMSYEEITEGFPNVDIDVQIDVVRTSVSQLSGSSIPQPVVVEGDVYIGGDPHVLWTVVIPLVIYPGTTFFWEDTYHNITFSYTVQQGDTSQSVCNIFLNWFQNGPYASPQSYSLQVANAFYNVPLAGGWAVFVIPTFSNIGLIPTFIAVGSDSRLPTFKSGSVHPIALAYYNRGNQSSAAQKEANMNIYVPFETDVSAPGNYISRNALELSINHIPPVWATHYQVLYAGNMSMSFYIQMQTISNFTLTSSSYSTVTIDLPTYNTFFPNSILSYSFQKGDRVRLISQPSGTPPIPSVFVNNTDVEIISYVTGVLTMQNISSIIPIGTGKGVLLEIYRPREQNGEQLYFSLNEGYEIGDKHLPTRYHFGKKQNQGKWFFNGVTNQNGMAALVGVSNNVFKINQSITVVFSNGVTFTTTVHSVGPTQNVIRTNIPYASVPLLGGSVATPAIVLLENGDAYIKGRLMNSGLVYNTSVNTNIIEDANYSDFYASAYYNKGIIPYPYDPTARRAKLPFIRYSKPIFESTMVNGLSSFNYGSFVPLTHSYGTINKVVERGFTLKVYQSFKTVSVYIGRTEFQDTGGNNSPVGVSQQTFGTITPAENDYGCVFPGSVVKHNNHIYYFDVNSGAVIRDSTNGPIEISKLGIEIFLKALSKQIMAKGIQNFYCAGGFDEEFDEYVLSIKDTSAINPLPPITLAFNETDNVWCSFYSFHPDVYGISQQKFVSFKDGQMWIHNAGTDYNKFYGGPSAYPLDNAPLSITVVGNNSIGKQKIFTYLAVYSDKNEWECPAQGDISIPSSSKYPLGMQSRLLKNHFRPKSRSFYADFLRDMLTPSGTPPLILNGRRLTGEAIAVVLNNNTKDPLLLYGASIHSIPVEKT